MPTGTTFHLGSSLVNPILYSSRMSIFEAEKKNLVAHFMSMLYKIRDRSTKFKTEPFD